MTVLNKKNGRLSVAVIEGWHPFEAPQWIKLFSDMESLDCYFQTIDNWAFDCAKCKDEYDVVLFYNMNMSFDDAPFKELLVKAIEDLYRSPQGKVILHHALLAYPQSRQWTEFAGIEDRSFKHHPDQSYAVDIASAAHPITQGIGCFSIIDETYTMSNAGPDSDILLTTAHNPSMRTLAWTRIVQNARVFCFQCGHDHLAWENPAFRMILHRGILWAANRL